MSANGIIEFSDKVINQLNSMPQLLPDWGYEDMRNNEVGGYFKNPVANVSQDIRDTCNTLVTLLSANANTNTNAVVGTTSEISTLFTTINTTSANVGGYNGGEFIAHTDRISGVTPLTASPSTTGRDTALLPHYDTAMSTGQLIMYLTYQSDGIQNNAPIIGNFTSLFTSSNLVSYYSTVSSYPQTVIHSINTGTSECNLTPTQISTISSSINAVASFMNTKITNDVTFYNNCQAVLQAKYCDNY